MQGHCPRQVVLPGLAALCHGAPLHARLSGKKDADQIADALIWHADVPMLLTRGRGRRRPRHDLPPPSWQTTWSTAFWKKTRPRSTSHYDDKLGFFTPILKGFPDRDGTGSTNLGMQVFGGHGYIRNTAWSKIARDARIATRTKAPRAFRRWTCWAAKVLLATKASAMRDFAKMLGFAAKHCLDSDPVGRWPVNREARRCNGM